MQRLKQHIKNFPQTLQQTFTCCKVCGQSTTMAAACNLDDEEAQRLFVDMILQPGGRAHKRRNEVQEKVDDLKACYADLWKWRVMWTGVLPVVRCRNALCVPALIAVTQQAFAAHPDLARP